MRWRQRCPRLVPLADDDLRFVALAVRARDRVAALQLELLSQGARTFAELLDRASDAAVDEFAGGIAPAVFDLADEVKDRGAGADVDVSEVPNDLWRAGELVRAMGLAAVPTSTLLWPPRDVWWGRAELLSGLRHAEDRDWIDLRAGIAREIGRRRARRLPPPAHGSVDGLAALSPQRQRAARALLALRPPLPDAWGLDDVVAEEPHVSHDGKEAFRYREGKRVVRVLIGGLFGAGAPVFDPPHPSRGFLRRAVERFLDVLFGVVALPGIDALLVDRGTLLADALVALAGAVPVVDDDAAVERVVWRVATRGTRPEVSAHAQRLQKNGKWSVGTATPLRFHDVMRGLHGADAHDQKIADAAGATSGTVYAAPLTLAVGRALVGHPRVRDDQKQAVRFEVHGARLVVDDADDGGLRLTLKAGPHALAPDLLPYDGERLFRAGDVFIVVDVDLGLLEVARALRHSQHVPAEDRERLAPALLALEQRVPLELPPSIRGELVPADGRLVVRLRPQSPGLSVDVGVRALAGADWHPVGKGPRVVTATRADAGARKAAARDFADELRRARALFETLPLSNANLRGDSGADVDDDEDGLAVLLALQGLTRQSAGAGLVVEWPENLKVTGVVERRAVQLRVQRQNNGGGDWLQVDADIAVDEDALSLALLLQAVREGRRFVRLSPGRFAAIEDGLRRRLTALAALSADSGDGAALPWSAASTLADLEGDVAFDDGAVVRELQARMARAAAVDDVAPRALDAALRPYQRDGLLWLRRLAAWGSGGVLADDMGLGKTLQALAVLVERAPLGPALVVAPTSVCAQWIDEARKFAPTLRLRFVDDRAAFARAAAARAAAAVGADVPAAAVGARSDDDGAGADGAGFGPFDVVVVTWTRLALYDAVIGGVRFATAIFDEAQAIKNLDTRRAAAARKVDAAWRLALTGTPIENHTGELWSLMRVVSPGLLGSASSFRERFQLPIERDHDALRRQALAAAVRPFILRRTKRDVAPELPARTEVVMRIALPNDEAAAYDAVRRVLADEWQHGAQNDRMTILSMITRLRVRACDASLDDEAWMGGTAKLDAAVQLVSDLVDAGHQVLLFSSFTRVLDRLAARLSHVKTTRLDGTTSTADRAARVALFQSGGADVFLLSLKAGGTGLNLTAADYVVLFDPWWNAAAEAQAADRAHRIGQARPVTLYRLIAEGTIEEQVLALQQQKSSLVDAVLEGSGAASTLDLDQLFALVRGAASTLTEVAQQTAPAKNKKKKKKKTKTKTPSTAAQTTPKTETETETET